MDILKNIIIGLFILNIVLVIMAVTTAVGTWLVDEYPGLVALGIVSIVILAFSYVIGEEIRHNV